MTFQGLTADEAKTFAAAWLPAWTGNRPEVLASFYSDDAFYSDPGLPNGITGQPALLRYFGKLLGQNPNWIWTHSGSIPMLDGFVNQWHASIPVGATTIEVDGVCLVQIRDGKIYANRVYFDRTALLEAITKLQ